MEDERKSEDTRWLAEVALALRAAALEKEAPRLDIEWLALRCADTSSFGGYLRIQSLRRFFGELAQLVRAYPVGIPQRLLDAARVAPGSALPSTLLRVEALALATPGAPRWDSVIVTGPLALAPAERVHVKRSALVPASEFEERFQQLLSRGHPWINVSAAGLLGDALLVTVETAAKTVEGSTSVNMSGPEAFVRQRVGWSLGDLISVGEET
jgi:hypothetical protein